MSQLKLSGHGYSPFRQRDWWVGCPSTFCICLSRPNRNRIHASQLVQMQVFRLTAATLFCGFLLLHASDDPVALANRIASLQLDPAECFRVSELNLKRGPVSAHLGAGWIILSKSIRGARLEPFMPVRPRTAQFHSRPIHPARKWRSRTRFIKAPCMSLSADAVMLFTDGTSGAAQSTVTAECCQGCCPRRANRTRLGPRFWQCGKRLS